MSHDDAFSPDATEFDVWLRMAADNKITAKNSWTVELIDYFYNLSIGRDVNFQRIAAILDGCVKIYASRVDSAVTETGTLLSGLASQKLIELQEAAEPETAPETRFNRKHAVRLESTLVPSFDAIKRRGLESELNLDPLFRRTMGLFDDGGAQSLLLNNLSVDREGRVVFDSSTAPANTQTTGVAIDIGRIRALIGDVSDLKICESMQALKDLGANNESVVIEKEADEIIEPELNDDFEDEYENDADENVPEYSSGRRLENTEIPDYELMEYFDNTLRKSAIRQDYWKVRRIIGGFKQHRKYLKQPKEDTYVDFFKADETTFEDEIFSESESRIDIPKNARYASDHHCLAADHYFNSRRLVNLFMKDRIVLKTFNKTSTQPFSLQQDTNVYTEEQEMSRIMADITREDIHELNQSYIEDFAVPTTMLHKKVQTLNFEKISRRIDIRMIKCAMSDKIQEGDTRFESIVSDIPQQMNGTLGVYFICLLHLANDNHFEIRKMDNELTIIH